MNLLIVFCLAAINILSNEVFCTFTGGFKDKEWGNSESFLVSVDGKIPNWLSGNLYRNGPGRYTLQEGKKLKHWFYGLAMV